MLCEENIDNCDPDPCHHGQCQDGIDSYTCICSPGYMGAICSDQIDECYSSPCLNEGRCIDLVNGYQCNCQPGTSGKPDLHCLWSFQRFSKIVYTDVSDFLSTCFGTKNIVLILRSTAEAQPETCQRQIALASREVRDNSFTKVMILCMCFSSKGGIPLQKMEIIIEN